MKKLLVCACLLIPSLSFGQATVTRTLEWTHTAAPSAVALYKFTVKLNGGAEATITPTCVANGSGTKCTAPTAAATSYQVIAYNGFGSTASDALTGTAPDKPGVTVTITLSVP